LLLILANSLKNRGRCVAGREVVWLPDGRWHFGKWVRPVGAHGQGELSLEEAAYGDGTMVQVMQFAEVQLTHNEGRTDQPENWVIAGPRAWSLPLRVVKPPPVEALAEKPSDLWLDPAEMNDKISPQRLAERRQGFSLCVVQPEEMTLVWHSEMNVAKKRASGKYRARFRYLGVKYELSLTDPVASERFCVPLPAVGEKPRTLELKRVPLVCVSLTPVFAGLHYKVAATLLGCA